MWPRLWITVFVVDDTDVSPKILSIEKFNEDDLFELVTGCFWETIQEKKQSIIKKQSK